MSTNIPNLPPRKVDSPAKTATEASTLSQCTSLSPMALLVRLETNQSDHKHVFKSFIVDSPVTDTPKSEDQSETAEEGQEKLIEIMDTEDLNSTPLPETTMVSRYICQVCHAWLIVTHTNVPFDEEVDNKLQYQCPGNDYICHHYHAQALDSTFQCCGCEYTLASEMQEAVLPMTVLKRLESTRPKSRSFADLMQQKGEQTPTMVSTLTTVLVYIKDLLNGVKRNINTSNPHFLARIGLSDGSQALLETVGFIFQDNYFIATDIEIGSPSEDRLKRIQQEIILTVDMLRLELGSTTVPVAAAEVNTKVKTANMQYLLGIEPALENRYTSSNDYLARAYASFGLTSGASDTLVAWSYKKLMNEPTNTMDPYDAMDSLMIIANQTNSDILQTLIACERSQGKIARTDIGDAYAYFGVTEDAADDRLLIGLYQVKLSDEPLEKNLHQDKLKTIAIARHSSELIDFLKEEKGITSSTNMQSVEDMIGVPAHMINNVQHTPVGLNNIGNTCYFNSLLQYYFTFIPFRNTMIQNELYVEGENSEPKKIGGIEVDQSEIRRAKKFVELLKALFINLQETTEKAISPEYELAYMALLNEKDDDAATDVQPEETNTTATPAMDTATKMDVDEPEPTVPDADTAVDQEKVEDLKSEDIKSEDVKTNDVKTEQVKTEQVKTEQVKNEPVDTEMVEAESETSSINQNSPEKEESKNDLPPAEEKTDSDIEREFKQASFPGAKVNRPDSPPPAYSESIPAAETSAHFEDDVKKPKDETELPKLKERPSVDTMMFGKQQDVTECMGNVMYLVETALKPLKKTEDGEQIDDMIRQVFYGKARQILSYCDNSTLQTVKKEMEEDFSHVIVDASEGKDLYDGLDEYFFADQLDFQGGHEATREVTVKSFPPVLQVLLQRVQFDRTTANVYKSNAYIQFDRIIYLDRYADDNFDELKERRAEVAAWRTELDKNKKQVSKLTMSKNCRIPVPDMLEATREILADFKLDSPPEEQEKYDYTIQLLEKEAKKKRHIIQSGTEKIVELKSKIKNQYNDYTKLAYKLHAVFIHQGQANYGHYWIYILDHDENQWWKYNDSLVSKVNETEIYHDTTGSTANPYFLVYVDANKMNEFVETIVKKQSDVAPVA